MVPEAWNFFGHGCHREERMTRKVYEFDEEGGKDRSRPSFG